MDESTPLNSANGNGNGANRLPTSNKNWKIVRDNHNMEATFKFTWSERQRALREKGVGQAAHLCRDGKNICTYQVVVHITCIHCRI